MRALSRPFRLGSTFAVFVIAATLAVSGMQGGPLLSDGSTSMGPVAIAVDGAPQRVANGHAERHAVHHPGHDSQRSSPGSSSDCTCIGPCQGGGAPTLSDHEALLVSIPGSGIVRVARPPARPIRQDPTGYLRPLPNAPPLV